MRFLITPQLITLTLRRLWCTRSVPYEGASYAVYAGVGVQCN